ncbi:DeoR family transcriptional regulator [Branchiibius hedensis]|uniref:DNA-binding transcriptional regulator of sugar metabolism, DeoR/GlpR family n=1 Tax=Branchiibius hedensis TaxID=672460 RepID=A0A2Y8ZQC8_9MICO|nr:DeoR/GlpR family DNA-binding transcription regulator [Branchiibius hedensis]PWJ24779.1 DeoR family transcriptional regulator [Branchiibius hedensis]SSA33596.1 DNA-binding transcriptional regulator of sugar metabolism, DeoR/GlpR family [Branchiibius hedensis]
MLAQQRQEFILRQVAQNGGVRVSRIVGELGVSDMTVRRDIDVLVAKGLVTKVHGGAIATRGSSAGDGGTGPTTNSYPVLGRAAASLVDDGATIALSAGAAAYAVATELRTTAGLSVVTNSPSVEEALHDPSRDDRTVVLTGGARTANGGLAGPVAIDTLARTHVDVAIISAAAVDIEAGVTTSNLQEAQVERAMIHAARRVVVVADRAAWGTALLTTVSDLSRVDVLVTDAVLSEGARRELGRRSVRVYTVNSPAVIQMPAVAL